MFSPEGYTPLAELWALYCKTHYTQIHVSACDYFRSDKSEPHLSRGSPLDMCEYLFIRSFDDYAFSLGSPDGHVETITHTLDQYGTSLFTVTSVFEASLVEDEAQAEGCDPLVIRQMGSSRFLPWRSDPFDIAHWQTRYPVPEREELR